MHSDPADTAIRQQVMNLFPYRPTQKYKLRARQDGGVDCVATMDDVDPAQVYAAMNPSGIAVRLRLQLPQITHISVLPNHQIVVVVGGHWCTEYLIEYFWDSIKNRNFDIMGHPNFSDYVRGVMALRPLRVELACDTSFNEAYPPRKLIGLDPSNLHWSPSQ